MANTPPFAIRFKQTEPARVQIYQDALDLAARIYTVIELATNERYFVRDQLDRKSTQIPQLISQALAASDLVARAALFHRARLLVIDCAAILDMMGERGTIEPDALAPARALATRMPVLLAILVDALTSPRTW